MKRVVPILLFFLLFTSCNEDTAYLEIVNKVSNVKLENMVFDDYLLSHRSILPGESTGKIELSEHYGGISFPKTGQIQFYMVSGENKVFLKTKESFTLNKDKHLIIEITNETEVINPITGANMRMAIKNTEIE